MAFLASSAATSAAETLGPRDVLRRLRTFTLKGKMDPGRPGRPRLRDGWRQGRRRGGPGRHRARAHPIGLLIHDDIMDRDLAAPRRPVHPRTAARLAPPRVRMAATPISGTSGGHLRRARSRSSWPSAPWPASPGRRSGLRGRPEAFCLRIRGSSALARCSSSRPGPRAVAGPERRVLEIYRYKTARYSPPPRRRLGARRRPEVGPPGLGRAGAKTSDSFFQIKDDELGLFGSPEKTGKPVKSDIREGKRTLLAAGLLGRATGTDAERLGGIFGHVGAADIRFWGPGESGSAIGRKPARVMARWRAAREIGALPVRDPSFEDSSVHRPAQDKLKPGRFGG